MDRWCWNDLSKKSPSEKSLWRFQITTSWIWIQSKNSCWILPCSSCVLVVFSHMAVVFEAPSNAVGFDPWPQASNQILDRRKPQICWGWSRLRIKRYRWSWKKHPQKVDKMLRKNKHNKRKLSCQEMFEAFPRWSNGIVQGGWWFP